MKITSFEKKAVSVCAVGGEEDCLYTRSFGKTYEHSRPDLNSDGLADAVIKDFSGAYGQNEVVHFMAFAQCRNGTYVKVTEDFLSDLKIADSKTTSGWADLDVTRICFNESLGGVQTRHFRLGFDRYRFTYGPPNNDTDLSEYCSSRELSLPASGP